MNLYSYLDIDSYYVYPNSSVLRNKLDIKDAQLLEEAEHLLVSIRLTELYNEPIEVRSIEDVCQIHRYLFQDVYDWSGEFRKVNISKSDKPFIPLQSFSQASLHIDSLISEVVQEVSKDKLILSLARLLDNLNYMHPFREGNGRTQREVIRSILYEKGIKTDINSLDNEEIYNLYMDGTINSDLALLKQLFRIILE